MGKVKILSVRVSGFGYIYSRNRNLDGDKIMSYDEIDLYRYRIAETYGVNMSEVNITYTEDIEGESDYY